MLFPITLSHRNLLTGEVVRTYHKVEARTRKQAERKRDELILELERKGGALATGVTVREFMDRFLDYKEESGTIAPSTVRGYRSEAKLICRYIGSERLVSVTIATVNDWMAKMSKDGYAPSRRGRWRSSGWRATPTSWAPRSRTAAPTTPPSSARTSRPTAR